MGYRDQSYRWLFAREALRDRAILQIPGGRLVEYYEESATIRVRPGSIFMGIVRDVVPAITAAFVEIGPEEQAFLQVETAGALPAAGDRVLVQITQGARSKKAPQASLELKLPGRFLVLLPGSDYVGVSKKITDEARRDALRTALSASVQRLAPRQRTGQTFGVIVRSQAETVETEVLEAELETLVQHWNQVWTGFEQERRKRRGAAILLHEELALPLRIMRDRVCGGDEVLTADKALFDELNEALAQMNLAGAPKDPIQLRFLPERDDAEPLFERTIRGEWEELTLRRVPLCRGGNIVIDQTEALTAIDVNSERFTTARVLEDTAYQTNREAAVMAARLIRLRNIGGIIIVDFIEMRDPRHREELMRLFAEELDDDPARIHLLPLDEFGLAKLTRKKQ